MKSPAPSRMLLLAVLFALSATLAGFARADERVDQKKTIVMVAGTPSHGPGEHEFNAGTLLLARCLNESGLPVQARTYLNGWPKDADAFDHADCIVLYMDGGGGHPLIQQDHLEKIGKLMAKGVGLVCLHYAVEIPKTKGGAELTQWIGGYYETGYSINPHWEADFKTLPEHPITRGVKPFKIKDEWYYNIRFPAPSAADTTFTPILVATPPDNTRGTPSAKEHPGRAETMAWAIERADGGRGFGFTGAHTHANWGNDNFRKLALNAIVWCAKIDVPPDGARSSVAAGELTTNLDAKGK